jgi:hypothetical protein
MKKLATVFTMITLATTLSLAGCKKKTGDEATDKAAKPADTMAGDKDKKDDKMAAAPDKMAAPAGSAAAAAPAAAGDLPAECNDYKAAIEKLSSCDKMPKEARDSMKQAFDSASAGWANLPAEAKAGLATACKAGADAVKQSAPACN